MTRAGPAPAARPAAREERGPPRAAGRQHRTVGADRHLRAGVQDAAARSGGGRLSPRRPRRRCELYGIDDKQTRATSAASACWPGGWSSAACASFRSIPAAPTTTTTGTPTPTSSANHTKHAGNTDKPIAGLAARTCKQRGLLDETLVVWGGEFGRQPTAEYAEGHGPRSQRLRLHDVAGRRRHQGRRQRRRRPTNSAAPPSSDRFHVKNLHATILHQMGLDPNRLSYFYNGLDQKLVGVEGAEPIQADHLRRARLRCKGKPFQ